MPLRHYHWPTSQSMSFSHFFTLLLLLIFCCLREHICMLQWQYETLLCMLPTFLKCNPGSWNRLQVIAELLGPIGLRTRSWYNTLLCSSMDTQKH